MAANNIPMNRRSNPKKSANDPAIARKIIIIR
jgi:hypothetical protein